MFRIPDTIFYLEEEEIDDNDLIYFESFASSD